MADSIRERIIQEVEAGLSILRTANGFNSDCGRLIERGKKEWDDTDAPCMSIFPGIETADDTGYRADKNVMPMTLNLFDTYTNTVSTVTGKPVSGASVKGEKMFADAKEAMKRVFTILTAGLVQNIQYKGGGIQDYPGLETKTIGVIATFDITYETKRNDPYNQL
ncbi:MAG: hypothetical protein WBN66_02325 [Smithella sp.]